ncbi:MAG: lactate utilization protein [Planctomycetes bacterium]|nr:lactate utilization protein [Planctomycetota bacterium]
MSGELSLPVGLDRQAFMGRVRAALARPDLPQADVPPPEIDESVARLVSPRDDLVALFCQRAQEAGMVVHSTTSAALGADLAAVIEALAPRAACVSVAEGSLLDTALDGLRRIGCEAIDWRAKDGLEAHYDADLGVTDVFAAVAESGSLVLTSDAVHSRGTFLVPPVHLALVPARAIVPDLLDLLAFPRGRTPAELPAALVLVTGPSKTADIEGILITGVHGPREVHVLVIRDAV